MKKRQKDDSKNNIKLMKIIRISETENRMKKIIKGILIGNLTKRHENK